jgi:hypothetical protein
VYGKNRERKMEKAGTEKKERKVKYPAALNHTKILNKNIEGGKKEE